MKDRIINVLVSVVMVVIALYPMYSNLKSTVREVNGVIAETNMAIRSVKDEIVSWQGDLDDLSSQVDSVKHELQATINNGLVKTENMINGELESLNYKIDNLKTQAEEKIKEAIPDKIDDLKKWIQN